MRKVIQDRLVAIKDRLDVYDYIVVFVGLATVFFGFLGAAVINVYLLTVHSPLVTQLRATLDYRSAILGDGIILPIVDMICISFVLRYWKWVGKKIFHSALLLGLLFTVYLHASQAISGLINWTMPKPWQWNILGAWHALYMFSVASLIGLFYLLAIRYIKRNKILPKEVFLVSIGVIIFFVLLRLDYISVNLRNLLP